MKLQSSLDIWIYDMQIFGCNGESLQTQLQMIQRTPGTHVAYQMKMNERRNGLYGPELLHTYILTAMV